MPTMKAVRIHAYGGPNQLRYEDAPKPQAGSGEVVVRVGAAGVNPVDWKIREGHFSTMLSHRLPLILGWDVSGVIDEIGPDVRSFQPGEAVYARPDIARDGAYAEFIVIRAAEIARKPAMLDHVHAAAVPLAALTAWQALFETARLQSGQTILIHAAAGGVGHFAVQFAKWTGARVIGTASSRRRAFLRELGVDEVIDYTTGRFEDHIRNADVVFDTLGGDVQQRSWAALKPGGILVSIVSPPSESLAASYKARAAVVFVQPNAAQLSEIAQLIDRGVVTPFVDAVLPLSGAHRAHALSQRGHAQGKVVLRVDQSA